LVAPRVRYAAVALAAAGVLFVGFAPVVQYGLSVKVPFEIATPQGLAACQSLAPPQNGYLNLTQGNIYNACLSKYPYPPINVTGSASLAYKYLGVGFPPFPSLVPISEYQFNGILHMSGSKIAAGEILAHPNPVYDPPGVGVRNESVTRDAFGRSNFTISVANTSSETIGGAVVSVAVAGSDGNYTDGNVIWELGFFDQPGYLGPEDYFANLLPGRTFTTTLADFNVPLNGGPLRFTVEVRGNISGSYFVTSKSFSYTFPPVLVDGSWVDSFMGIVDQARNGSALVESPTLDQFAALRFNTASSQPDISDYGLARDYSSFFGSSSQGAVTEVILFPGQTYPILYAASVNASLPLHWSALTNLSYTRFGYYIGTGGYEFVNLPCSVTEIPSAGINITQYFTAHGCQTTMQEATWLVIVLGN
jgi:hypothetical protein